MDRKTFATGPKGSLKWLAARAMRPGLLDVTERLARLEQVVARIHQRQDDDARDRDKYEGEIGYWRWLIKQGGAEEQFHGESFETVFGRWQRERLLKLGEFLGLEAGGAGIDSWASCRSVVEVGAGPYPAVAAAHNGWKRCVAVDPLARGYVEEGLLPGVCDHVTYIEAPGERIPLPNGFADLVIIENCLDHVSDPEAVVREINRLLRPGGHLWFFVDLSNHTDHMHPHKMDEQRVRSYFSRMHEVRVEVSDHKAHPEAYGSLRGLYRKRGADADPTRAMRPAHATRNGTQTAAALAEPKPASDAQTTHT